MRSSASIIDLQGRLILVNLCKNKWQWGTRFRVNRPKDVEEQELATSSAVNISIGAAG